jgi:3-phosphoshikimate 1-carboxyvinyltransferase
MKEIKTASRLNGTVVVPGSKSITHRALIAAGLASGESVLRNYLDCEDTRYTIHALRELGVSISIEKANLRVKGTGGTFWPTFVRKEIYLGNSGTSLRLLLSVAAIGMGEFLITGAPRMLERPIGPLVTALNQLGVKASCVNHNNHPPVLLKANGIQGGKVRVAGDQSSQFVSSLLLAGPCATNGVEIEVVGEVVSAPYVDITLDVMEEFGIHVDRETCSSFKILSGQVYRPRDLSIQGDASSASYFWAAAAVTRGTVATLNIDPFTTRQGDIGFLEILEKMGCSIKREADGVSVRGGRLSGIDADMSSMPDMVPTLAAIALFSQGTTFIRNVHHLRLKESDRLHAIACEWNRLGGRVEEIEDGLIIHGGRKLSGTTVDPHDDHRLAMSLAVMGLKVPGVKIRNEGCVDKSFPQFWELWDTLS